MSDIPGYNVYGDFPTQEPTSNPHIWLQTDGVSLLPSTQQSRR